MESNEISSNKEETVWFREEERWELTWPIWHMLPHEERKALARKHGYHTIGDFEEYMTLKRAVGDSQQQPYDNEFAYNDVQPSVEDEKKPAASVAKQEEGDEESDGEDSEDDMDSSTDAQAEELTDEELLDKAGKILILPEELIHTVFDWLPVDTYATLALVSPHWRYLTRTEAVYKRLCERCYLNQSKRRSLNVSRFGHSYRIMLQNRPRVRAGGGLYALQYKSVKKIQRDMWTEIPVGAILETVYYRYLYFQENGTVLYALTTTPPHEMVPRFWNMMVTKEPDKAAVWGHYQVRKNTVTVIAKQEWQVVRLEMSILPESSHGRFGALSFDRHLSSSDGTFEDYSGNVVNYKVPDERFRFLKDRRL